MGNRDLPSESGQKTPTNGHESRELYEPRTPAESYYRTPSAGYDYGRSYDERSYAEEEKERIAAQLPKLSLFSKAGIKREFETDMREIGSEVKDYFGGIPAQYLPTDKRIAYFISTGNLYNLKKEMQKFNDYPGDFEKVLPLLKNDLKGKGFEVSYELPAPYYQNNNYNDPGWLKVSALHTNMTMEVNTKIADESIFRVAGDAYDYKFSQLRQDLRFMAMTARAKVQGKH